MNNPLKKYNSKLISTVSNKTNHITMVWSIINSERAAKTCSLTRTIFKFIEW